MLGVESVGRDPEVEALMSDARDAVIDRMAANQARGGAISDELRLVLRIYLGAAEAAAREWAVHGRASREQVHAVLKLGTMLAMVGQVLPAVPPALAALLNIFCPVEMRTCVRARPRGPTSRAVS